MSMVATKSYVSRVEVESKLPDFEGVKYTITKLTEGRRLQLRSSIWDMIVRSTQIREELVPLQEQAKVYEDRYREMSEEERNTRTLDPEYVELVRKISPLITELLKIDEDYTRPAYFRACFVRISGLTVNGISAEKLTADLMIDQGPPELVQEITDRILAESGLSAKEKETFESPTTSGAAVDGQTTDSTAPSANLPGTTLPGTVISTSHSTWTSTGETGGTPNTPPTTTFSTP